MAVGAMSIIARGLTILVGFTSASAAKTKLSDGLYCPVSDVEAHGNVVRDVREIKLRLACNPPDYSGAKAVYMDGIHSSKGGTKMRTLQGLAQKDMTSGGAYINNFHTSAVDLYGSVNKVWDTLLIACFDKTTVCKGKSDDFRGYVINKGLLGILTAYATYEMGAAIAKADLGELDDATQAPHAWDEAAAFYIGNIPPSSGDGRTGNVPGNLYSPYEFNWKRDTDFPLGVNTHLAAVKLLNFGLKNIRTGSYVKADVEAAQTEFYKLVSIAAIRSAIKYSFKAYNGGNTFQDKYLAEGSIYWRSASGYLSSIDKAIVTEVDGLMGLEKTSMKATDPCRVKKKVQELYPKLNITCSMVGEWKDYKAALCANANDAKCEDPKSSNAPPIHTGSETGACKAGELDYAIKFSSDHECAKPGTASTGTASTGTTASTAPSAGGSLGLLAVVAHVLLVV